MVEKAKRDVVDKGVKELHISIYREAEILKIIIDLNCQFPIM